MITTEFEKYVFSEESQDNISTVIVDFVRRAGIHKEWLGDSKEDSITIRTREKQDEPG